MINRHAGFTSKSQTIMILNYIIYDRNCSETTMYVLLIYFNFDFKIIKMCANSVCTESFFNSL